MAKIYLNLDTRSEVNGQSQIRVRIVHNRKNAFIGTAVYVGAGEYTGDLYRPIKPTAPLCREKTEKVATLVRKLESSIYDMERYEDIENMTVNEIRDTIMGAGSSVRKSFTDALQKYGDSRGSIKSTELFCYTARLIKEFIGDKKDVTYKDITYKWLKEFDAWMEKKGKNLNTRGIIMRNIRCTYNEGVRCEYIPDGMSPFRFYKIPRRQQKEIVFSSFETIHRLLSLDLRNQQGEVTMDRARDIFMISVYLCGMNLVDIFNLPPQKGDEVVFVRSKIAKREPRPTHIHIEPPLQELIDKYKGKNHLFNFAETYHSYYTFQRNLTGRLGRLSALLGEKINMDIARHTWATLASSLGVDKYVISKSLGHIDTDVTGIHYIEYDWKHTANANRLVIEKVLDGVVPNSIEVPKQLRTYTI